MTTVVNCVIDSGNIVPLDRDKLREFKLAHTQGDHIEMILSDHTNTALTPMARKFFAVRDEYAHINSYSSDYAHVELKHLFGVVYPFDSPPKNREVKLVNAYGEKEWQLSIREYDSEELSRLLNGAEIALSEVRV